VQRFKNILAYIDVEAQRQPAFDRAVELARENGAALTLVTAVQEPPWWTERLFPGVAKRWYQNIVEDAAARLTGLTARYRDELVVATRTLVGRPWMEVIREVLRGGHDLVMKDVAAAETFSPALDMKLLRKCPCPVWLVKRSAARFRRIAAAVDVLPEDVLSNDDGRNKLNAKIIELAHELAVQEECELHIIRAWSMFGESVLHYKLGDEEIREIKRAQREETARVLEAFLSRFSLDDVELHVHVLEGEPDRVIPALVEREHEDLLVMGTIARTGVAGLVIGNTAESILSRLNCSVLAVKPDDFVSPVRLE
jgi:nucleotide-binding universal stress UspA family protein